MTDQKKVDQRAVAGEIIAKCWQDEGYKKSFIADPKKYLVEAGVSIPEKMQIKVVEQDSKISYTVLPAKINIEILQKITHSLIDNSIHEGFKLPENGEMRFVQNTARLQYFILPAKPAGGELGDADLDMVTGGAGVTPSPVIVVTPIGPAVEVVTIIGYSQVAGASSPFGPIIVF